MTAVPKTVRWGDIGRIGRCAALSWAAVWCAACPQRTAVWIARGSGASGAVFHVSDVRGGTRAVEVGGIRVDRCDHEPVGAGAMWVVGPRGGTAPTREVSYGVTPSGWESVQGPKPLTPGCYQVTTSGTGRATFEVRPDGSVVERAAE